MQPPSAPAASPWPHRLALATALSALPLFLFGGSVTTLGAGMAVEGWWIAEGHFLPLFPLHEWFRDVGTFVEHTHRLFGMLVGLGAIATVVATWRTPASGGLRALAAAGLVAVCVQGSLGGFRVLESSPGLAFLHGAVAQAVFALLWAVVVVASAAWRGWRPPAEAVGAPAAAARFAGARWARSAALAAVAGVYLQIAIGAWYRHGLRPAPAGDLALRFGAHLAGALAVVALVVVLARALRTEPALARARLRVHSLLGAQLLLGFVAWLGYRPGVVTTVEWTASILHVLFGALLLAQAVGVALWLWRPLTEPRAAAAAEPALTGGGAS